MTRAELAALLVIDPERFDEPVVLALGKGRILAPFSLRAGYMQPIDAAGYGILHTDAGMPGEPITIISEAPRIEPPSVDQKGD